MWGRRIEYKGSKDFLGDKDVINLVRKVPSGPVAGKADMRDDSKVSSCLEGTLMSL